MVHLVCLHNSFGFDWLKVMLDLSDSDGWLDIQISYSICAWPVHYFTPVYVLWVHTGSLVDSLLNFTECMKQNDYKIIWTMRFFYMIEQFIFL